ncbi:MAG: hypothetical protein U9Q75_02460 [Pseudomonadota bacterium]|nr:hypothetical protein [Pseudomonadota bacterium]
MKTRIILNGKKAGLKSVRDAISETREQAPAVEVRTTYEGEVSGAAIVGAVCNGRQAGGGQVLAPNACINDGLLDVLIVKDFSPRDLPQVIDEILNPSSEGQFAMLFQTPWVEMSSHGKIAPVNLDGEPYRSKVIRFEVLPGAIDLVLPEFCPMLQETH